MGGDSLYLHFSSFLLLLGTLFRVLVCVMKCFLSFICKGGGRGGGGRELS